MKNNPMNEILEDLATLKPEDFHLKERTEEEIKSHRREDLTEAEEKYGMEGVARILRKSWDPVTKTMNRVFNHGSTRDN